MVALIIRSPEDKRSALLPISSRMGGSLLTSSVSSCDLEELEDKIACKSADDKLTCGGSTRADEVTFGTKISTFSEDTIQTDSELCARATTQSSVRFGKNMSTNSRATAKTVQFGKNMSTNSRMTQESGRFAAVVSQGYNAPLHACNDDEHTVTFVENNTFLHILPDHDELTDASPYRRARALSWSGPESEIDPLSPRVCHLFSPRVFQYERTTTSVASRSSGRALQTLDDSTLPHTRVPRTSENVGPKRPNSKSSRMHQQKFTCHFRVDLGKRVPVSDVNRRIIGPRGANMKAIVKICPGAKIRLREARNGRAMSMSGPKYQLHVSCINEAEFIATKHEVHMLLTSVYAEFGMEYTRDART